MAKTKYLQERALSFIYEVSDSVPTNHPLTIIMQCLYFPVLICVFFISTNSQHHYSILLMQTIYLPLTVSIVLGLICLQLIVAYLYHFQFMLLFQLTFFRYILFPPLIAYLAAEITDPYFIQNSLAYSLLAGTSLLTYMFSSLFFQSNNIQRILWKLSSLSSGLVITDCLLVLIRVTSINVWMWLVLSCWLILSIYINTMISKRSDSNNSLKVLSFMHLIKEYMLCIVITNKLLNTNIQEISLLQISWPAMLMLLGLRALFQHKEILNQNIFNGDADKQIFFDSIKSIHNQLVHFKNNQNICFQQSYLMVFIASHQKKCKIATCPLLQPSTIQELKNSAESNNLKILIHKIIKKIQFLFEVYQAKYISCIKLKLLLLYFYMEHLPNKLKISELIISFGSFSMTWEQKLIFYGLNRKVQKIEAAEVIGSSRGQDEFLLFKKMICGTLTCLRQFWEQLLQEKVNLSQLMSISARLFPLKKQVQYTWKKHLNQQKFASWNILRTYIYYRKSILHDHTNADILEDYCKIIEQRLKAKHELGYINSQTQQSVIAISLTESSLGDISSLNNQMSKLFSYGTRSQMLDLRVNDIMPSVYSVVHDNILSSFLKNRYKQINQDQRFVFGKNKNGYIFPILLQLRKLSWNANDELIFIANIQIAKIKSSPIYCITDIQGDIQDYTSTFVWLFLKKQKNKLQIKRKNIQELLPSFFEVMENVKENSDQKNNIFQQKSVINKNGQQIEVEFSATELYIKQEKVGYLVEGHNICPMKTIGQKRDFSSILKSAGELQQVFRNNFNPNTVTFQIPNNSQPSIKRILNQFTIPFLKTSDFQNIININSKKEKVYGADVKTLRLISNRLQHIAEEQSFHSDDDNDEWRQKSVLKRIQKLREDLNVDESRDITSYYRYVIVVMTLTLMALSFSVLYQVNNYELTESNEHQYLVYKWNIRQLLSQYLIYFNYPQTISNSNERIQSIHRQLVQNIMQSNIAEWQKQSILKIIEIGPTELGVYLTSSVLDFTYSDSSGSLALLQLWQVICALQFIFLAFVCLMFMFYKHTMANIYLIFLSISDKKLHSILQESIKLFQYLSISGKDQAYKFITQEPINSEKEDQQFQRVKKMNNDYTREDLWLCAQFMLPIIFIFAYSVVCTVIISQQFDKYQGYAEIWKEGSTLLPQASLTSMQSAMSYLNIGNFSMQSNYYIIQQQFQRNIFSTDFDKNNKLLELIKGDPCQQLDLLNELQINITKFCSSKTEIMKNGVTNALNLITTVLTNSYNRQLANLTQRMTTAEWTLLVSYQFDLLKPLLGHSLHLIHTSIQQYRLTFESQIIIFMIISLCMTVCFSIYIVCYPIRSISQKLLFTKDLINIVPNDKQTVPKQAFAHLTTEAMDFD